MDRQRKWPSSLFRTLWLLLLVGVGFPLLLYADNAELKVAVLYPQIRDPYLGIFLDIIDGVEEGSKGDVVRYPLKKGEDANVLIGQINSDNVDVIVALGKRSYDLVRGSPIEVPILLGALSKLDDSRFGGIAMIPSAEVVLQKMKMLAPAVNTLHIVYSPKRDQQLIDVITEIAKPFGVQVRCYASGSLKESAGAYQKILKSSSGSEQAIWLLSGGTVLNNAILADVLEMAWHRKIVVFSSVPAHVKRGALFAVYPDNRGMGKSLGVLALDVAKDSNDLKVVPLKDVRIAVNQRTGDHLGLVIDSELREKIDLLLPSN